MMISATLLLFASTGAAVDAPASMFSPAMDTATPQGISQAYNENSGGLPPSGGTPEPGILLLLAGGGLAYGAVRLRKKKNTTES